MNTHMLKGNWSSTKGKLRQRFSELTDNDLTYVDGKEDELFRQIEKKTGQTREQIEFFLEVECGCVGIESREPNRAK
jgi:uncharacterized protein YjbJ (UPF0337 family)